MLGVDKDRIEVELVSNSGTFGGKKNLSQNLDRPQSWRIGDERVALVTDPTYGSTGLK